MVEPLLKTHETDGYKFELTDYAFTVERKSDGVRIDISKTEMGSALVGLGITQIAVVGYRKDQPVEQPGSEV